MGAMVDKLEVENTPMVRTSEQSWLAPRTRRLHVEGSWTTVSLLVNRHIVRSSLTGNANTLSCMSSVYRSSVPSVPLDSAGVFEFHPDGS